MNEDSMARMNKWFNKLNASVGIKGRKYANVHDI